MDRQRIRHEFVEFVPQDLSEGVLYISIEYATAVHRCFSGCGEKVVTPLTPTDWSLIYDGDTVSLTPSIGNWGFNCQSHYWITHDEVVSAPKWTRDQIEAGRRQDFLAKRHLYEDQSVAARRGKDSEYSRGLLARVVAWVNSRFRD